MTSIRQRLLSCLLVGLGIVWLTVGIVVCFTVRTSLEGKFDAELKSIASEVHYVLPEGGKARSGKPSAFWFDFFQKDSGLYFEVWDQFLLFSDRSPNLGKAKLPKPDKFTEEPRIWNFTLTSGEKLRGISQQFTLAGGRQINVVVARNRDRLDGSIQLLLAATGLVGLLLIPISYVTVRVAVGRGLQPLRAFDARVAAIGMESLHERLETTGVPEELLPISRRLNELMDRLEAGVARERRLNADLAHELRTPITELRTMAEVALTWPDKIDGSHYRNVLEAAQHMQSVVEGMLLMARCDQGADRPARETVNVADLVRKCWQPHAERATAKRLRMEERVPPEHVVESNPDLLQIMLGNLVANAVEYSPEGGSVVIASGQDNGCFRLSVENSVENLTQTDLPHLFERFWRRDAARRATGHAGLGLALAKSCAEVLSLDLSAELGETSKTIVFKISTRRN